MLWNDTQQSISWPGRSRTLRSTVAHQQWNVRSDWEEMWENRQHETKWYKNQPFKARKYTFCIDNKLSIRGWVREVRYSWIGRPMRTHAKSIYRDTERATINPKLNMKSSHWGSSNGMLWNFTLSFLKVFLKTYIDEKFPKKMNNAIKIFTMHSWIRLVKSSNKEVSGASEIHTSVLRQTIFLGIPAAVSLLGN